MSRLKDFLNVANLCIEDIIEKACAIFKMPDFLKIGEIKKKACAILLEKCGSWLKDKKFSLDQITLDVNISNFRVKFRNFHLNETKINQELECYGLPFEVVDCFVGCLDILVPFPSLFSDNSSISIEGLQVTLRHASKNQRKDSSYNEVSNMQGLSEACHESEGETESDLHYESLYELAGVLEKAFTRARWTLTETTICFEQIQEKYTTIFQLEVERLEYFTQIEDVGVHGSSHDHETKKIVLDGIKVSVGVDARMTTKGYLEDKNGENEKMLTPEKGMALFLDFLGKPKIEIEMGSRGEDSMMKIKIKSDIEGANIILCPQVVRHLYEATFKPPSSPVEGVSYDGSRSYEMFLSTKSHIGSEQSISLPVAKGKQQETQVFTEVSVKISFVSLIFLNADDSNWIGTLAGLEDYMDQVRKLPASTLDLMDLRKQYFDILRISCFSLMVAEVEVKVASKTSSGSKVENNLTTLEVDLNVGRADLTEVMAQRDIGSIETHDWLLFKRKGATDEKMPSIKIKICSKQMVVDDIPSPPHLHVAVTMSECSSEVDLTVVDRMGTLVAAFRTDKQPLDVMPFAGQPIFDKVHINLECPRWTSYIRFPNYSPKDEVHSVSQRMHKEFLLFTVHRLQNALELDVPLKKLERLSICLLSTEGNFIIGEKQHRFLSICPYLEETRDCSRITFTLNHDQGCEAFSDSDNDDDDDDDPLDLNYDRSSRVPFSAGKKTFKNRELVEPANREEMTSYLENESSSIKVVAQLQKVFLEVPSYNVTDLLLKRFRDDMFPWCVHMAGDVMANLHSPTCHNTNGPFIPKGPDQFRNLASILIVVKEIELAINVPEEDQNSKFALAMRNLELGCVPCRHGESGLRYLSIQADALEFSYLDGSEEDSTKTEIVQVSKDMFGLDEFKSADDALSLTVAMKVKDDGSLHFKLAVMFRNCFLHHVDASTGDVYWTQMLTSTVKSITDLWASPDNGSGASVELHVGLKNCAIEFKPKSLPYHVILMSESCHMSVDKNSPDLEVQVLRVYLEDTGLFLSGRQSGKKINLRKDFVCVADVNSFDFTSKTMQEFNWKCPRRETSISLGRLSVRTCSDSFAAITQVLLHLVNYDNNARKQEPKSDWSDTGSNISSESSQDFVMEMSVDSEEQMRELLEDARRTEFTPELTASHRRRFMSCGTLDSRQYSSSVSRPDSSLNLTHQHLHRVRTGHIRFSESSSNEPTMAMRPSFDDKPIIINGIVTPPQQFGFDNEEEEEDIISIGSSFNGRNNDDSIQCSTPIFQRFCDSPCASSEGPMEGEEINVIRDSTMSSTPKSTCYLDEDLRFIKDHYQEPEDRRGAFDADDNYKPEEKLHIHEATVSWSVYGGKDFSSGGRSGGRSRLPGKGHRQKGISWSKFCGPGRNQSMLMEFHVKKIQGLHEVYPEGSKDASKVVVFVREVEILDKVEASDINKFLHLYSGTSRPVDPNMFRISLRFMRDATALLKRECTLKMSLMPLKFNIDQHSLTFLWSFVKEILGHFSRLDSKRKTSEGAIPREIEASQKGFEKVYFRSVKFSPETVIKVDYKGNMAESTSMIGLLTCLLHINQSQIILKKIECRRGMRGVDRLVTFLLDEWTNDIKTNQMSAIVKGIGPLGTLANMAHGVRDLFYLPFKQYKRDGRFVMGLQRGAYSFVLNTLMSTLDVAHKSVHFLQSISQFAHDVVSSNDLSSFDDDESESSRLKHPEDLREGLQGACAILKEGLNTRVMEVKETLMRDRYQEGMARAIGGVLRQMPQTVIDPILAASKATANLLEGARNQFLPEVKKEEMEKWKFR